MPLPDPKKIIPGNTITIPDEANILNTDRAGHADRDRTITHLQTVAEKGYITPEEANTRITHAMNTHKQTDLHILISDLPAPFQTRSWLKSYDWGNRAYWAPTLLLGSAVSAATAVVPSSALAAAHLFPHDPVYLAVGITTIILGVIGFIFCIIVAMDKT
jgi:hypothetical protein